MYQPIDYNIYIISEWSSSIDRSLQINKTKTLHFVLFVTCTHSIWYKERFSAHSCCTDTILRNFISRFERYAHTDYNINNMWICTIYTQLFHTIIHLIFQMHTKWWCIYIYIHILFRNKICVYKKVAVKCAQKHGIVSYKLWHNDPSTLQNFKVTQGHSTHGHPLKVRRHNRNDKLTWLCCLGRWFWFSSDMFSNRSVYSAA